jgi:hypothetical protein
MKVKDSNRLRTLLATAAVVAMSMIQQGCAYIDFRPDPPKSQQLQLKKIYETRWYDENDPAQKGLNYKFRGAYSGQLVVDGFGEKGCVVIYDDKGKVFFNHGLVSPANRGILDQGQLRTPVTLKVIWRAARDPQCRMNGRTGIFEGGTLIGDYTVPVASRIPDDLLEAVRQGKGGLRLKIRVSDNGPLIGWDLETNQRYPNIHLMSGGDFREAMIDNGKPIRKGWYIDKITGRKIETDF